MNDVTPNITPDSTLKSCPFCGGEAKMAENDAYYAVIECKKCHMQSGQWNNESGLIKAWNQRHQTESENDD